jgi:hypothetical protein
MLGCIFFCLVLLFARVDAGFVNTFIGSDDCSITDSSSIFTVHLPSNGECIRTPQLFHARLLCSNSSTSSSVLMGEYETSCHANHIRYTVFTNLTERICYNHTQVDLLADGTTLIRPESFSFLCDQTNDLTPFSLFFPTRQSASRFHRRNQEEHRKKK